MASLLICERHQAGEDRAGQAGAAKTIFVVGRAVREGLRLANQQTRLRIGQRRDIWYPAARESQSGGLLIEGFREHDAYSTAGAIEPAVSAAYRSRVAAVVGARAPACLEHTGFR